MKILITGGAGFIGTWLVRRLDRSMELIVIDSMDQQVHRNPRNRPFKSNKNVKFIKADIRDVDRYRSLMEDLDAVVHLAAQTGTGQSMYEVRRYVDQNAGGTARLLETLQSLKKKPKRIILASSRAIYGEGAFKKKRTVYYSSGRNFDDLQRGVWEVCDENGLPLKPFLMREDHEPKPVSIYGMTKLWQEQLVQSFAKSNGVDYMIFRIQNLYGPGQSLHNPYTGIIGIFTNAILKKKEVELFEDGMMTRDFVYIEDAVRAFIKAIHHARPMASTLNLATGTRTTLNDLVRVLSRLLGVDPDVEISGRYRMGDIRHAAGDPTLFRHFFGDWSPVSWEEGLKKYLEWYLIQPEASSDILKKSLKEMQSKGYLLKSKNA